MFGFAIWDGRNIHCHSGLDGDHGMKCFVLTV